MDNRPYEVYHHRVSFVANLIGQAIHIADSPWLDVAQALGPSEDLGVWIPKKEEADTTSGQRQLQLPSTLRRIFGGGLMAVVGPAVEPLLSTHQSAIRGGSCGPNIPDASHHLASTPCSAPPDPGTIWSDILGDIAAPCLGASNACTSEHTHLAPVCVLADQSKAFERVSIPWLREIMRRWKFPAWITAGFIALVADRRVCNRVGGSLSKARLLRCGAGMGGPASAFQWNLAYDPLVLSVADGASARCHTYVDDLCGPAVGPAHANRLLILLTAAGHAAGLRMDMHQCSTLHATTGKQQTARLLRPCPARVLGAPGRGPDAFTIHGMPGQFCMKVLTHALGHGWASTAWVSSSFCSCTVKTVLVPAHRIDDWKEAMDYSLFGASAVRLSAPYLGGQIGAVAHGAPPTDGRWTLEQLERICRETWPNAIGKYKQRTAALHGSASIGMRTAHMNIYIT